MDKSKRPPLKTDGPTFIPTLCAVLVELASMYDAAVAEERSLVNARTKIEKDLAKVGDEDSPEANRVRVADSKIRQALKACRAQIDHLGDQMRSGIKYGQQPMLIQSEHEDRILELVAGKQDVEHRMELWQTISAESRKVGTQTGEGEEGPVGEPEGDDDDGEEAGLPEAPAPLGNRSLVDDSLRHGDKCHVVRQADGELLTDGEFETFMPKAGAATVRVKGSIVRFELEEKKLAIVRAPASPQAAPRVGEPDEPGEPGVAGMIRGGEVVDGSTGKPAKAKSEKPAKGAKKAKRA